MPQHHLYQNLKIITYSNGKLQPSKACVVNETPLTIFLNGAELATLICSPGADKELAVGFLLHEGLIQQHSDIESIIVDEKDGLLWVKTTSQVYQTKNLRKQIAGHCGKGRASLYGVNQLQPVQSSVLFPASQLLHLISILEGKSATFRLTGGVHSAALANNTELLAIYEDIGRHNAVDKILGYAFLNKITSEDKCLIISARISSEIIIKAFYSGIPLVASRSAPTYLAVDLADQLGIALIGFARGETLNVYSHTEKVII